MTEEIWKKCSSCKKAIQLGASYYVCSVSTCQHIRTGYQFCSVECWDAHLGYANHRESWAIEKTAPKQAQEATSEAHVNRPPQRKIIPQAKFNSGSKSGSSSSQSSSSASLVDTDILVVVSKVKKLIKDQSGFNTSQCCIEALTKKVIQECLRGIKRAEEAERKTVMGRDILS